jgi:hypothetical protein
MKKVLFPLLFGLVAALLVGEEIEIYTRSANVYKAKDRASPVLMTLRKGETVNASRAGEWYAVTISTGSASLSGFIHENNVRRPEFAMTSGIQTRETKLFEEKPEILKSAMLRFKKPALKSLRSADLKTIKESKKSEFAYLDSQNKKIEAYLGVTKTATRPLLEKQLEFYSAKQNVLSVLAGTEDDKAAGSNFRKIQVDTMVSQYRILRDLDDAAKTGDFLKQIQDLSAEDEELKPLLRERLVELFGL